MCQSCRVAYDPDPLQEVIARRFRQGSDGYHFRIPGQEASLPVSEDEMLAAEQTLRDYSAAAKAVGLLATGATFVWAVWAVIGGGPTILLTVPFAVAILVPLVGSATAAALALRPYKKRLLAYERAQPQWRPRGWMRAFADLSLPLSTVALACVVVGLTLPPRARELIDRYDAVRHGDPVVAHVLRSEAGHSCLVEYAYGWRGRSYSGETSDCWAARSHRPGSSIAVRVAARDPGYSVPQGEGVLTADIAGPFLIIFCFALAVPATIAAARSYVPPRDQG